RPAGFSEPRRCAPVSRPETGARRLRRSRRALGRRSAGKAPPVDVESRSGPAAGLPQFSSLAVEPVAQLHQKRVVGMGAEELAEVAPEGAVAVGVLRVLASLLP